MERSSRFFFALALIGAIVFQAPQAVFAVDNPGWNFRQFQRLVVPANSFSFAVLGDIRDSQGRFERIISRLNGDSVLFSIVVGDLVSQGKAEEFALFFDQAAGLKKPFFAAIGNHDIEQGKRDNYLQLIGAPYYSFQLANSYFIILDGADESALDEAQLAWLKVELARSQACANRFVFMHLPLYDPRKGDKKLGHSLNDAVLAKRLNDIFDENKVTMLFVSHIHGYFQGAWGKTPYIITGGGGAPLVGVDPKNSFFHYIKVNVSDAGVSYDIIRL